MKRSMWSRMSIVLLAVTTAPLTGCDLDGSPAAVGTLERDRIELAADSGEPIVAILVQEGDRVSVGDVLLRQDPARPEARLAQARAARDQAVAQLEEAVAGPRAQEIAQAEARLAAADSAVITARLELEREQSLVDRHFVSRNRLDILQGEYDAALARQREAAAALDQLREGTRSEVVKRARESLSAAEARVRELEILLTRSHVTAPIDAVVEALPREVGERPRAGETVVVLRALGPTYARVHVPAPLRESIQVGSAARIRLDGRDEPLDGRVRWIATEAAFTPYYALTQRDRSRLSYQAEVVLENADAGALPVGVPVEVRFPGSAP